MALIVKEEMNIYWDKLNRLNIIIEEIFGDILEDWDGALEYFKPLESIVKKEFE